MTVIQDASLPAQVSHLPTTMDRLGDLDFASPEAIGTSRRRCVIDAVAEAERVRDEIRRLAAFNPPLELQELPAVIPAYPSARQMSSLKSSTRPRPRPPSSG